MRKEIKAEIEIPEGINFKIEDKFIKLSNDKGELLRKITRQNIIAKAEGNKITFNVQKANNNDQKIINTLLSHIKNMIKGLQEGFEYKLKICSSHFPMNVKLKNDEFSVVNFLGEKHPRKLKINPDVDVKIEGNDVTVKSMDIEKAGQVAGRIEKLTRVTGRDTRIFQDGIYITHKAGKSVIRQ